MLTQQELQSAQKAYGVLVTEHQQLQELRRHEERESYEVTELFRRQIVDKNAQLEMLKHELAGMEQRLEQCTATAAQREAQLQREFAAERQQLGAATAALQQQLDGVARYHNEKKELEAEMYHLRKANVNISEELGGKVSARLKQHIRTWSLRHTWASALFHSLSCTFAQIRRLQRRLYELGYGADGQGEGPQDDDTEEEGGSLCLQADLHRILAYSRKMEGEMKQYGQVRLMAWYQRLSGYFLGAGRLCGRQGDGRPRSVVCRKQRSCRRR